jgi:hypothetical protein
MHSTPGPRIITRCPDSDITVTVFSATEDDGAIARFVRVSGLESTNFLDTEEARQLAMALVAAADELGAA